MLNPFKLIRKYRPWSWVVLAIVAVSAWKIVDYVLFAPLPGFPALSTIPYPEPEYSDSFCTLAGLFSPDFIHFFRAPESFEGSWIQWAIMLLRICVF